MSTKANEGRARGKVAFCFPGQGSLEAGMGREIAEAVPEAMAVYERGSESCGLDLRKLCFSSPLEDIVDTSIQQPALLATSLAILAAIEALGFRPDYVVGHSVGEFAALAAGRALEAEDAIGLVRERGLAMAEVARQNPGAMAAILGLEDEVVEEICREIHCVWPANYNCPGQVVISGQTEAVDECCEEAEREGARRTVKLPISGAFHSPLVARAAERFRPVIERVRFAEIQVPFMSTVSARLENSQKLAGLLVDQLTAPVRFTQATRGLISNGVRTFVEIGPGNVLSGLVKRIDRSVETISVNSVATLKKVEEVLSVA
ncbi:MAG: ACP S-malonyltransferase [Gaiellaceae bacterium]